MFQIQAQSAKPILFLLSLLLAGKAMAQDRQTILNLDSTNPAIQWKVRSQEAVGGDAATLFASNYNASSWVAAQVPGTVFTSYVNAGIEKDPNFGDNIYRVDKSKWVWSS